MNNKTYNFVYGSLVGLIDQEKREEVTSNIIVQTNNTKGQNDIENICKGILCSATNEERQAVRVAKNISLFLMTNKNK